MLANFAMCLISLVFLFVITANSVVSGDCPSFQNFESQNSVAFNPIGNAPKQRISKSSLKEATLWHNCVNCEAALNDQINMELRASYIYQAMAQHFNRDDVALTGFYKFFEKSSLEEREHANKFMAYMLSRGGNIVYKDIQKPDFSKSFETPAAALKSAFDLESQVYASIRKLHDVASISEDVHLMDFLESQFYTEQIQALSQLSAYMTQLKRMGCGLGEHMFDQELEKSLKS